MTLVSSTKRSSPALCEHLAVAPHRLAGLIDHLGRKHRHTLLWHSHQQAPAPLEFDRQRRGLDLDAAVFEAHVEHHARRQTCLASQAAGDHHPPRGVDGSLHGSYFYHELCHTCRHCVLPRVAEARAATAERTHLKVALPLLPPILTTFPWDSDRWIGVQAGSWRGQLYACQRACSPPRVQACRSACCAVPLTVAVRS